MPKVFGLNLAGLVAGSVAFFFLGFLWYGVLFDEKWTALMKLPTTGEPDPLWMMVGFFNVLIVTLGIGLLLKWLNVSKLMTAVKYGLIACICFALTTDAYNMIYAGTPAELFMINASYNLVGYAMVAAIWSFFE